MQASGTSSDGQWAPIPMYHDSVFRWVFGTEQHAHVLRRFLKAAMPDLPAEEWTTLALPNTHLLTARQKEIVFDVLAVTSSGRRINVEIQTRGGMDVRRRFTFTNSTLAADQLNPGDPYTDLSPVVTLVISTFVLLPEDRDYRHTFWDYDPEHHIRFTSLRELRTLELPKLADDDGTDLWDWLRLIGAQTEEEIDMAVRSNPDLREAADLVKEFSADEARRHAARAHQRYLCDQATLESHAREQGRHEAISTVAQSMPVEQVADIFGITPDEVTAIVQAR